MGATMHRLKLEIHHCVQRVLIADYPEQTPVELCERANVTHLVCARVRKGMGLADVTIEEMLRLGEAMGMTFSLGIQLPYPPPEDPT